MKKLMVIMMVLAVLMLLFVAVMPVNVALAKHNGNPHDGEPPGWSQTCPGEGGSGPGGDAAP